MTVKIVLVFLLANKCDMTDSNIIDFKAVWSTQYLLRAILFTYIIYDTGTSYQVLMY